MQVKRERSKVLMGGFNVETVVVGTERELEELGATVVVEVRTLGVDTGDDGGITEVAELSAEYSANK